MHHAPPLAPAAANGNGSGNGHAAPALAPAVAGAAPAAPAPAAIVAQPAPAPAADDDDAAAVVEDHLRTMERFLETGHEVMQAYLGHAPPAAAPPWPLLGEIVEHEPGVGLVARRSVDPDADPYLRDHTLGRVVSRTDPALRGLPLMPLAMSLEVLAEGAAALVGAGVVTGLRDVRAHRWIAFPGPLELEVAARRLPGPAGVERVRVELRDRPGGAPARRGHRDRPHGLRRGAARRSLRRRTASARRSARPARCTAR